MALEKRKFIAVSPNTLEVTGTLLSAQEKWISYWPYIDIEAKKKL